MEELASLRAKPQLDGAPSPALLVEGCLARSSQPKHILRVAGTRHHSNKTAELSSIIEGAFFPWCSMARMPVIHKRVSFTIPGMRPAFACWHSPITSERPPWAHLPASLVTNPVQVVVEDWNSVEVPSRCGSSNWINGREDNRPGIREEDDSNTGEVGERELVLVFSELWGARWNMTRG